VALADQVGMNVLKFRTGRGAKERGVVSFVGTETVFSGHVNRWTLVC